MISFFTFRLISWVMKRTRAGDVGPTLRLDHDQVRFVFPGSNSWSGTFDGKPEHKRWLERLVRVGVKTEPDEVAVGGFPWNMRVAIRGRSWWDSPAGERIYENRFVIFGHIRWGKLRDYEVYEDTEKAQALDDYLEANQPALMAA
jgi:ketosteroid isomerase-like protein